jgi:DNA-binding FrmR family transcriptional regulator
MTESRDADTARTGEASKAPEAPAPTGAGCACSEAAGEAARAETPSAHASAEPGDAVVAEEGCCCCGSPRYKNTPRSAELQRSVTTRLNRVIGQLNGVKSMIEDNRYCGDVLTQLAAAQSALSAVSRIVLQNHLETCVVERIQQGDTEVIDELMGLIKKFS